MAFKQQRSSFIIPTQVGVFVFRLLISEVLHGEKCNNGEGVFTRFDRSITKGIAKVSSISNRGI